MTPELMRQGAKVYADHHARKSLEQQSAGDAAANYGRVGSSSVLDVSQGVVLYVDDISVSFDGFKALNNLSLSIGSGELRCIIGPNGAGKTTMMDVITGKTKPDSGKVFFGTNGASELLGQVFGPVVGAHARSAFGVAQIPLGACVEIEMIAEVSL